MTGSPRPVNAQGETLDGSHIRTLPLVLVAGRGRGLDDATGAVAVVLPVVVARKAECLEDDGICGCCFGKDDISRRELRRSEVMLPLHRCDECYGIVASQIFG